MMFRSDSMIMRRPMGLLWNFGWAACTIGLALACAFSAWLSQRFAVLPGGSIPVADIAAGVALAGLLLGGNRLWPGVALGALAAHPHAIEAFGGSPAALVQVISSVSGQTLQAFTTAMLVRNATGAELPFFRAREAGLFVLLGGLLGSMIGPTFIEVSKAAFYATGWDQFTESWMSGWLGSVAGTLLAAPLILAWSTGRGTSLGRWQGPELILLITAPFAVGVAIGLTRYPIEYLYLPLLTWAAFRFGPRGATVLTVVIAAIAVAMTIRCSGSFVGDSNFGSLLLLEPFLVTIGSSTLILLGVIAQRDAAERGLADATATLETRVRLRTQELAAANGRLRRIADLDGLTGVANRRFFDTALQSEWLKAEVAGQPLAVILMDVDYFKVFNDTYGHPAGDECLQSIAEALNAALQRTGELLARYGGEEFVVLLPNAEINEGVRTAERLRAHVAALEIPHRMPAEGSRVSLSAGVASRIPGRGISPAELLACADTALYAAKRDGRNRVAQCP